MKIDVITKLTLSEDEKNILQEARDIVDKIYQLCENAEEETEDVSAILSASGDIFDNIKMILDYAK